MIFVEQRRDDPSKPHFSREMSIAVVAPQYVLKVTIFQKNIKISYPALILSIDLSIPLPNDIGVNATDYLRLRAKIDAEYRRKIGSLDEVWALDNDEPPPQPINSHADAVLAVRGAWRPIAQKVVDEMPIGTPFTVAAIKNAIGNKIQLSDSDLVSISTFLKNLADSHKLEIVEPGKGRRGTIYSKK